MKEIKSIVGNRIQYYRKQKCLSQEKLAIICELDRTYISSVENGKRNISIINIDIICKALNIKISELFKNI